jgi:PAS domain S-box-containing protein
MTRTGAPLRFGIKQKLLLVLIAVLAFTITLVAMLASYYTDRQNEEAASASIGKDLLAWQEDLQARTEQLRKAALAVAGDEWVLNHLAEVLTLDLQRNDPMKRAEAAEIERTLAYSKTVALYRLYLMLRTGAFSSITVYTQGQLSHYISPTEAGMLLQWDGAAPVWTRTDVEANGSVQFQTWPSWQEGVPPSSISSRAPEVRVPSVITSFPTEQTAAIDVVIPVEGLVRELPHWRRGYPSEHVVSDLVINGAQETQSGRGGGLYPRVLSVIVFRSLLDRSLLNGLARKTGKQPVISSADGSRRLELSDPALLPADLIRSARNPTVPLLERVTTRNRGSFYVGAIPWVFEGQPRLVLGFALSRENTLRYVHQTVTAILILAALILLLSVTIGMYWIGRFTEPIVALTAAVKRVGLSDTPDSGGRAPAKLDPIQILAPDEIGDLAAAFNSMLAELRRSFELLEGRVLDRTAELRQQTRYLRTLIDTLPLSVCLKDTHGRYLAANEPLARALGLERGEDMTGKADVELWPPEEAAIIVAEDQEVLNSKQRKILETQQRTLPHDLRWFERFRAPVLDEDGTALGIVVVSRDITLRKEAEAARENAVTEAMRLARMRSDFLARMSHELRTPLNAIIGYAQILQHQPALTDHQTRGIATILSSGEHLLTLINDILDLARIDAGKLELAPSLTRLSAQLESVTDIVRVKAQEKGIEFHYETAGLPAIVMVDAKRLRQVLLNLLSNAVKFTDVGQVALRVLRLPSSEDSAGTVRLRFEVEDSGIGMSSQHIGRLFQPFEQLAEAPRRESGSGLGLAISQQLVELMGGQIKVQSELGQGSLFRFDLEMPVASKAAADAPPQKRIIDYEGPRRSILLVDDVENNRVVLMDMLTPLGFDVFDASDGRGALLEAERLKPDLIVMDVMMPVMDGLEVIRRLRLMPGLGAIPIIAVSASAESDDITRARDAGANAMAAKPLQRASFLELIGQQLRLKWIVEDATAIARVEEGLIAPPLPEIDVLHQLAVEGHLTEIGRRAHRLLSLDARYAAFATQLEKMANAYQSKAVLSFLSRYRA